MPIPLLPAGAARPATTLRRPLTRRRVSGASNHLVAGDDADVMAQDASPQADPDTELHQALSALDGLTLAGKRPGMPRTRSLKGSGLRIAVDAVDAVESASDALTPTPELSPSSSNASSPPLTPTPDATEEQNWELPHFAKVAAWALDLPLPGAAQAPGPGLLCEVLPSGARLTPAPGGGWALMLAVPRTSHDHPALGQIFAFGFSSNATRLRRDDATGKLIRQRNRGQATKLHAGTYAFVIDQSGELLVSLTANKQGTGPAGAHRSLAAGLPVLFAGELTIADGDISRFTPGSGNYLTPPELMGQARAHPLLAHVPLHLPETLGTVANLFAAADAMTSGR